MSRAAQSWSARGPEFLGNGLENLDTVHKNRVAIVMAGSGKLHG